jgi:putative transcriptional regulator
MICRLASLIDEKNLELSDLGLTTNRLSQRRLAGETGLAATTLNRLYNNDFDRVDVKTVENLCNYFGCEVGELLVMREVTPTTPTMPPE